MMIKFSSKGWDDYLYWQATDRAMLKRINMLIKEIEREPFTGKGKPEPLKHQLSGFWSRRIDAQHRLVYAYEDDAVLIALKFTSLKPARSLRPRRFLFIP